MEQFLLKGLRKAVQIVAKTNSKIPALIEIDAQNMQGKGSRIFHLSDFTGRAT